MQVSIHIHPGQFRVTRFSGYATIEMTETTGTTTADAAIFLRTRDQCDELIKAAVEARDLLPATAPAVTSPVPVRAEQVMPGGYTLPAGEVDEDDTWRQATDGPPEDLTDGKGDYSCPAQAGHPLFLDGPESLLCWRRTGHDGRHYDGAGKRWWDEDGEPRCEADFSGAGSPQCLKAQDHEGPHIDETGRRWVFGADAS